MFWNEDNQGGDDSGEWLTLTWDVLKYEKGYTEAYQNGINFNMGCFEICRKTAQQRWTVQINFNMRCIKIQERPKHKE